MTEIIDIPVEIEWVNDCINWHTFIINVWDHRAGFLLIKSVDGNGGVPNVSKSRSIIIPETIKKDLGEYWVNQNLIKSIKVIR